MIWWILRFVMLASIGWFANNALQDYQESQENKQLAEDRRIALEAAVEQQAYVLAEAQKRHNIEQQILSDALEARQEELAWARSQKAKDELIKEQLRGENAELDKALRLIINPMLAP